MAELASAPEGLALEQIEARLAGIASRRTLQRRLAEWSRQGLVRAEGVRRGRRYFRASPSIAARTVLGPATRREDDSVPISDLGREVQSAVRRPIFDRTPVGYQRDFLDRYEPNTSAYLPEVIRGHLREIGRSPDGRRPAGTYARDILNRLLVDLSWASSRLEGNTYSLLDTRRLIEEGKAAAGKDAKETQMILNHKAAIELLVESAEEIGVDSFTILNLHALLADNLLEDPRYAGRLRDSPIAIAASTYIPTAIPQLIEDLFQELLDKAAAIRDPFEQSFFLMVHLPNLQPFVDVNQRTSRLAANIPLIKGNFVPLSFIDVPEQVYIDGLIGVYELNRIELLRDLYVWAYERSARRYKTVRDSIPEPDAFRLKYRNALIEVVGDAVRSGLRPTRKDIARLARPLVAAEDLRHFTDLAVDELNDLHEGNIARFRLRPFELRHWREKLNR